MTTSYTPLANEEPEEEEDGIPIRTTRTENLTVPPDRYSNHSAPT